LKDKKLKIRQTKSQDIKSLSHILDSTGLFPSEMLPEMIDGFLTNEKKEDIWLSCLQNDEVIGFCYAVPEPLTEGTWNMLAIAIQPENQGMGAGSVIIKELELLLKDGGHRILIVDTSGTQEFERTREFYRQNNYNEEARIRDFWSEGDDKIIFWKSLK